MKTSLLAILVFYSFSTYANNYYFSSSIGDDTRTNIDAQNPSTPWKSLDQLNSIFSTLQPGDAVLFKRGDVFYGSLKISQPGASANQIVFDAYGTGAAPVITGFTTVSSWSNLGNNIWESSSTISALSTANMVLINGVNTAMGRYPNTGYLTYQTFSGNTSITSSSINSGTTNWTGAEVVIKKTKWILDRGLITSHSGGTLVYSGGGYVGRSKFGFFIQNDSRTLDKQNEWYYNPSTKKIRIYSSGTPVKVQVSTVDTLVYGSVVAVT
jgi:hypothetical protein